MIREKEYESAQRKLRRAEKLDENNLEILNLLFHVGYILVKSNNCEYNVRETMSIAEQIKTIDEKAFEYQSEYDDLGNMCK